MKDVMIMSHKLTLMDVRCALIWKVDRNVVKKATIVTRVLTSTMIKCSLGDTQNVISRHLPLHDTFTVAQDNYHQPVSSLSRELTLMIQRGWKSSTFTKLQLVALWRHR